MKPYWQDKSYGIAPKPQRKLEQRAAATETRGDLTNPSATIFQLLLSQVQNATGITVTPLKMLGIATVFACIRVRSTAMASLPLNLYKGDGEGGRKLAYDHRLFSIMNDAPNSEMSSYDFMIAMEGNLSLRQTAYAEIMVDSDGDPVGLYPIEPVDIYAYRNPTNLKLEYQYSGGSVAKIFPAARIVHLRGYTRNGIVGMDNCTNLQEVFALAVALQDNAAKFFGNGSRPGGILEHPAVLSSEAQDRIRNELESSTKGVNANRMMILEEGMKYSATRSENKDSQFLESREYQDLQICRIFGVPPHKVGIVGGMPRANVEEENIGFVTDVIRPECVNFEKKFNMMLLSIEEREQGYSFEFDLDALMRGNMKERFEALAMGRNGGWLNANEIRRKEKMNGIGKIGDIYLQPVNYVPLGTMPAAQPAPAAPGNKGGDPTKGTGTAAPAAKPGKPAMAEPPEGSVVDDGDPTEKLVPKLLGKPKELANPGDLSVLASNL